VSLLFQLFACNTLCQGPSCESEWPNGQLAMYRGGQPVAGTMDALGDASAIFDGTNEGGTSWSTLGVDGAVLVGQPDADRVLVLEALTDTLTPIASWSSPGSQFGAAIAADRSNRDVDYSLWVGGPEWNLGTGAVWLFRDAELNRAMGLDASTASLRINGNSPSDRFGSEIAVCGDMTGDNLSEIAIAAPWFDAVDPILPVPSLAGAVFLLRSENLASAANGTPPWELGHVYWGTQDGDGAGHALHCDRDLTGDGIPDLVIGAPWVRQASGRVYVIDGANLPDNGPLDLVAYRTLEPPNVNAENWFGMSLEPLDIFGDDASDLAVGTPGFSGGRGRVLIYRGASIATTTLPSPVFQLRGDAAREAPDHMGRWLTSGRFYGNTWDDLVVGAPDFLGPSKNDYDMGQAWIWRGDDVATWDPVMQASEATAAFTGTTPFQRLGRRPAMYDIDGDGREDLLLPNRTAEDVQ
jgi:hypothetical protein